MGSSKKIFSGVLWSIIMNLVNALYGFIMIPLLISYFGKAEYGLIGLAQSVNAYMQLMDMGLTSTNVRFFSNWLAKGDAEKVKKLFSTCTAFYGIIGIINALVLMCVYLFSDSIFNVTTEQDAILKNLLLILAVSAFINWLTSCYNQIIQATENVAWTQKRLLFIRLLMIGALLATIWLKLSIGVYFLLSCACTWVVIPVVMRKIKSLTPMVSFLPKFDKQVFKEILPYTLNIFSFSIFSFSFNNLKPVFLGMQSTPESVTDYKVIMGIVGIVSSITGVFMTTLLPSSSKIVANNDRAKIELLAYNGTKYLTLFIGFCVFGMMTIAGDLLIIYVGDSFKYLVPWLLLMISLQLGNHNNCISSLILGGSNIKPLSVMTAVSSVVALVAAWFLIEPFGVGGVVIASAIYSVAQIIFYYVYYCPRVLKLSSLKIVGTILIPIIAAGLFIWGVLYFVPHFESHWTNIVVFGCLFAVVYLLFCMVYLNKEDKNFLFGLIKKQ